MVAQREEGSSSELFTLPSLFFRPIPVEVFTRDNIFFQAKTLFDEAALDIEEQLIQTSASGLTYIAEMK